MKKSVIILAITAILFFIPAVATATTGIGVSSPHVTSATIEEFPFSYSDTLRIYNTGTEEGIYSIKITAPYPDVEEWVSIDKPVFTLQPDTSTPVTFSIDAKEGYTGTYEIVFTPTLLPKEAEGVTGAMAYLALGSPFKFTVIVPEDVGEKSLGDRELAQIKALNPLAEIIQKVRESKNTVIFVEVGNKITLTLSKKYIFKNDTVNISASFTEGGTPFDTRLLLVSPSGKEYKLARTTSFTFTESGRWSILVVVGGTVVLGKSVYVVSYAYIGLAVLVLIVVVATIMLLRMRRRRS
jgi:hypothetical protein